MLTNSLPPASSVPHLRDVFAQNPKRFDEFSRNACGITFDFSKQRVTTEIFDALLKLADDKNIKGWRTRMFAGERINTSEDRAVLHVALRAAKNSDIPYVNDVHATKERFLDFAQNVRSSSKFTDILCIGIGGSDLGPRMVVKALSHLETPFNLHFISNVDASALTSALKKCDPATTLIIIASKTFTTIETMMNARTAVAWLTNALGTNAIADHCVALSTNEKAVNDFGIKPNHMFAFADWVGGRYSLWSCIGLPIAISYGADVFEDLLRGARDMDDHFRTAPHDQNIPVLMGLLGVWNRNILGCPTHMILPYDDRLSLFVKHIQQVDMESNGKVVMRDGGVVHDKTGPQIFGEPGTDSQHSFMQLVHQGSDIIPVDFIACAKPDHNFSDHHAELLSNMLAQARALAFGQTLDEAGGDESRVFNGNRPSTVILLPRLDAYSLGALIAAYEHKVFTQGIIWGLNSFDQPGVELGKILAKPISHALRAGSVLSDTDSSTSGLMKLISS
jgi:glucose-6-phosphate isomerase